MFLLILDRQAPYLQGASQHASLLTLPIGTGSLLARLVTHVSTATSRDDWTPLVMPMFPSDRAYEECLRSKAPASLQIVSRENLETLLGQSASKDDLLVVDTTRFPAATINLADRLRQHGHGQGATHMIAMGTNSEHEWELIEQDRSGGVKRVQRMSDRIIWPKVASERVFMSFVPARLAGGIRFASLSELRSEFLARVSQTRDEPIKADVVDLTDVKGALALNEKAVWHDIDQSRLSDLKAGQGHVLLGRNCHIDRSADLAGPVVIHDNVTIEAGATIIGPTTIGQGSTIRRDAVIARSILAAGTTVASGAIVLSHVASGEYAGGSVDPNVSTTPPNLKIRTVSGQNRPRASRTRRIPALFTRKWYRQPVKRALDIILSIIALGILSPLLIALAVVIKLTSAGPVFFIDRREGKGGKEFACLKFRTMIDRAHDQQAELYECNEVDGPQFKLAYDPRVTRVGAWLRGVNLDEIPQLFNVLVGHMSLVGPRPSPFRENQICMRWRRARLSVRPGITGLWQMCHSLHRGEGDFQEWIIYDIAYVRRLSIWLDAAILAATALQLVTGRRVDFMSRFVRRLVGADKLNAARSASDGKTEAPSRR